MADYHRPQLQAQNTATVSPRANSALNTTVSRIEAIASALRSLEIDFRDRIDAGNSILLPPAPGRGVEPGKPVPACGVMSERLDDIEQTCRNLAERVSQLRELLG